MLICCFKISLFVHYAGACLYADCVALYMVFSTSLINENFYKRTGVITAQTLCIVREKKVNKKLNSHHQSVGAGMGRADDRYPSDKWGNHLRGLWQQEKTDEGKMAPLCLPFAL